MPGTRLPLDPDCERLRRVLRVGPAHVGRGVFAILPLPPGIVVAEIKGRVLSRHPDDSSYCMDLPSGRILEPAAPLRFLNHSCEPNCELFYWFDEDQGPEVDRLWLQTIHPIESGGELLIDYCWPAHAAIPCRCNAPLCRGWIVDPDERHLLPPTPAAGGSRSPWSPSA